MKKNIKYLIVLIVCLLFMPGFSIQAKEGISNYVIDATVLANGDLKVKEAFYLEGSFNGFERIIKFANDNALNFDPNASSFGGSLLHNADSIIIDKVGSASTNSDKIDLNNLNVSEFDLTNYGNVDNAGVYEKKDNHNSVSLKIYNPSSDGNRIFYIEYTLKNIAIIHNDVAEIGWNLFSDELIEDVSSLIMTIHIPNNKEELKVWGHGPVNGNVEKQDNQTISYGIDDLNSYTAIDVRFTFDKSVISKSTKYSNVMALDKIIAYELDLAEQVNAEREKAQILYFGAYILFGLWVIGIAIFWFYIYKKYDKEYRSEFINKYFREFPNKYGPEIVEYLFEKKVDSKGLSSAILNLIAEKHVSMETIDKKNAKLKLVSSYDKLGESDQLLASWLFTSIGKDNEVTLKEIKDHGKIDYEEFFKNYNLWITSASKEAVSYNFFENTGNIRVLASIYSILGIMLSFGIMGITENVVVMVAGIIIDFTFMIYSCTFNKRTKAGNEDYAKWRGLKNFISDFGNFEDRDLPDMILWEKYLVYAHVFGLAEKLSKTMEVKISQLQDPTAYSPSLGMDLHHIHMFTMMNRTINNSVSGAMSNAVSTRATAQSNSSDGFGGGGGFSGGSFGGGSFGGGGGGGRF